MPYSIEERVLHFLFPTLKRQAEELERLKAENEARRARAEQLIKANQERELHTQQLIADAQKSSATLYALLAKINAGRSSPLECKPTFE